VTDTEAKSSVVLGEAPVGVIRPDHERGRRAMKALAEGRLEDATENIEAHPDTDPWNRAWRSVLDGLVAVERIDWSRAATQFMRAVTEIVVSGFCGETEIAAHESSRPNGINGMEARLAALALEKLGFVQRRQDRPGEALRSHRAAYRLRVLHGSREEQWESAISIGLDADVAGRGDEAEVAYRTAIERSGDCRETRAQKWAVAWQHLSTTLIQAGRYDEAVSAAREAADGWRKHDRGDIRVAQADRVLGWALLKLGESLFESDSLKAQTALDESVSRLGEARETLVAFGREGERDAATCLEQKDFAARLRASCAQRE